jgi:hypothetical protein
VNDNENKVYVATVNVPGYLPMDDDPPTFDTAAGAWAYLADERERDEDAAETEDEEYSDTVTRLRYLAETEHGTGVVYGCTPGREGEIHDLGLAYCVTLVEREDGCE